MRTYICLSIGIPRYSGDPVDLAQNLIDLPDNARRMSSRMMLYIQERRLLKATAIFTAGRVLCFADVSPLKAREPPDSVPHSEI